MAATVATVRASSSKNSTPAATVDVNRPNSWSWPISSADRPLAPHRSSRDREAPVGAATIGGSSPPAPPDGDDTAADPVAVVVDAGARRVALLCDFGAAGAAEAAGVAGPPLPLAVVPLPVPLAAWGSAVRTADGLAWVARLARWARSTGAAATPVAVAGEDAAAAPTVAGVRWRAAVSMPGRPDAPSPAGSDSTTPGPGPTTTTAASAGGAPAPAVADCGPSDATGSGDARAAVVAPPVSSSRRSLITLQRQEVLALLAQHPPQALDVVLVELAVARGGPLGIDQALALQEADLRDGDVGELLAEQGEDVADGQVGAGAHSVALPSAMNTSLNLPICTSSPLVQPASSIRARLT